MSSEDPAAWAAEAERLGVSPAHRAALIAALIAAEQRGAEKAAKIVDHWHISKGGFSQLAWTIRDKAGIE